MEGEKLSKCVEAVKNEQVSRNLLLKNMSHNRAGSNLDISLENQN